MVAHTSKKSRFEHAFASKGTWHKVPPLKLPDPSKPKVLRQHQTDAYRLLKDAAYWVLKWPTAAGKTLAAMVLCWWYLLTHRTGVVVVAVPQTGIGLGYVDKDGERFCLPDQKEQVWWHPGVDLCGGPEDETKVDRLLGMLEGRRHPDPNQRIAICSHSTLLRAAKRNVKAFQKVLLVIDEAHHCQADSTVGQDESPEQSDAGANQLGVLVRYALENPKAQLNIGLTTATFFRGDYRGIVGEHFGKFQVHKVDYIEFFDRCLYLEGLDYWFGTYQQQEGFSDAIDEVLREHSVDPKLLVYLPSVNSAASNGKLVDLYSVWCGVAGSKNPRIDDSDPVVTYVWRGRKKLVCIDLVTDKDPITKQPIDREPKKQYLQKAHKGQVPLDVVVGLGMAKEGVNWGQARLEVIIGRRDSLTENVQIIGRLLRDVLGKPRVTVYHLLPEEPDLDPMVYQDHRLKAVLAAMVLEELYCPPIVIRKGKTGKTHEIRTSRLLDLTGQDLSVASMLHREIHDLWIEKCNLEPDSLYKKVLLREVIGEVLKRTYPETTSEDVKMVWEQTVRTMARKSRKLREQMGQMSVEDLEEALIKEGLPWFLINAWSLRDYQIKLRERRKNWFPRFWSRLLEHLYLRRRYTLRCTVDSLLHHLPSEPVEVTCLGGHDCSLAPRNFARRLVCTKCQYTVKPEHKGKLTLLRVAVDHISPDDYRLGAEVVSIRAGHRSLSPEQRRDLEAIGLDLTPPRPRCTKFLTPSSSRSKV